MELTPAHPPSAEGAASAHAPLTPAKRQLTHFFESRAVEAERWRAKNPYYYQWLAQLLQFIIPSQQKVLEVGSGLGDLISAVRPTVGVGIDLSAAMVALAARRHPQANLRFTVGDIDQGITVRETFDVIIASDVVGYLDDIQTALANLRVLCHERTRLVVTQYNRRWEPVLHLGARLGFNQPKPLNNWLSADDLVALLDLAGFEVVTRGHTFLCPKRMWGAGEWINRTVGRLPGVRRLCLVQYFVARPRATEPTRRFSVSVVVPLARTAEQVAAVASGVPSLGSATEIIFAVPPDAALALDAIAQAELRHPGRRLITCLLPAGTGRAQAVERGVAQASGQLVMVLDAALGVAGEELAKFYQVVAEGKAEVLVGSRLVYPHASGGLPRGRQRYYRWCGRILSWVIHQRVTDPLCRVKVFRHDDQRRWSARARPAVPADEGGEIWLLLQAARLGLKIAEIPVHYRLEPAEGAPQAAPTVPRGELDSLWQGMRRYRY